MLQIPMDATLKARATAAARAMGFSSLQESVRVWFSQIIKQTPIVHFEEPAEQLSQRAIRRYNKMIDDIDSGRVKTKSFTSVAAMMQELRS